MAFPKGGGSSLKLEGYNDNDMAGDIDGWWRIFSVLYLLGSSSNSKQSHMYKVVAISTCEAEYITAATTACQRVWVWLSWLLHKIIREEAHAPTLTVDKQSPITLAKNSGLYDLAAHGILFSTRQ